MMWMGKLSAWSAVAIASLLALLGAAQWNGPDKAVPAFNALCAALLLVAAFRTLRKLSGGLRLLCGAWGLTAGLTMQRSIAVDGSLALIECALAVVALAGLALTVRHKEK